VSNEARNKTPGDDRRMIAEETARRKRSLRARARTSKTRPEGMVRRLTRSSWFVD